MWQARVKFVCVVAVALLAVSTAAGVPNLISYQGQLNDQEGMPVNGAASVVFSLYSAPTGGAALWTEGQAVAVSNGTFSVQLGAVTPLPPFLFSQDALYLGIKVGADAEMAQRQQITCSIHVLKSEPGEIPIGGIIAWNKSMTGTPALPDGWVECNGQVLSDTASPYNGATIPNLNGESRFLQGGSSSGTTGGSATHNHQWYFDDGGTYWKALQLFTTSDWHFAGTYNSDGSAQPFPSGSYLLNDGFTTKTENKPPSFQVVWIMRVK